MGFVIPVRTAFYNWLQIHALLRPGLQIRTNGKPSTHPATLRARPSLRLWRNEGRKIK